MDSSEPPWGGRAVARPLLLPTVPVYASSAAGLVRIRPAGEFGPLAVRSVHGAMVTCGWSHTTVNNRVNRVKRLFMRVVSRELIPRVIWFGPRARQILRPFVRPEADAPPWQASGK